jgi:hypothetical protein
MLSIVLMFPQRCTVVYDWLYNVIGIVHDNWFFHKSLSCLDDCLAIFIE